MNSLAILEDLGIEGMDKELRDSIPHLSDKMLVDLVNGIEVIDDHIKVSEKRTSKINRFIDGMNGKSKQRQDLINKNLSRVLETATEWLKKHEYELGSVNVAITKVTTKLIETRQGVMNLNSRNQELSERLMVLSEVVTNSNQELSDHIREVDFRTIAEREMDRIFDAWEADSIFSDVALYPKAFLVLDKLRNSNFAIYLEKGVAADKYKTEMLQHAKNRYKINLARELNADTSVFSNKNILIKMSDMMGDIQSLKPSLQHTVNYLSDWSEPLTQQTWLINQLTDLSLNNQHQETEVIRGAYPVGRWLDRTFNESFQCGEVA